MKPKHVTTSTGKEVSMASAFYTMLPGFKPMPIFWYDGKRAAVSQNRACEC